MFRVFVSVRLFGLRRMDFLLQSCTLSPLCPNSLLLDRDHALCASHPLLQLRRGTMPHTHIVECLLSLGARRTLLREEREGHRGSVTKRAKAVRTRATKRGILRHGNSSSPDCHDRERILQATGSMSSSDSCVLVGRGEKEVRSVSNLTSKTSRLFEGICGSEIRGPTWRVSLHRAPKSR